MIYVLFTNLHSLFSFIYLSYSHILIYIFLYLYINLSRWSQINRNRNRVHNLFILRSHIYKNQTKLHLDDVPCNHYPVPLLLKQLLRKIYTHQDKVQIRQQMYNLRSALLILKNSTALKAVTLVLINKLLLSKNNNINSPILRHSVNNSSSQQINYLKKQSKLNNRPLLFQMKQEHLFQVLKQVLLFQHLLLLFYKKKQVKLHWRHYIILNAQLVYQ